MFGNETREVGDSDAQWFESLTQSRNKRICSLPGRLQQNIQETYNFALLLLSEYRSVSFERSNLLAKFFIADRHWNRLRIFIIFSAIIISAIFYLTSNSVLIFLFLPATLFSVEVVDIVRERRDRALLSPLSKKLVAIKDHWHEQGLIPEQFYEATNLCMRLEFRNIDPHLLNQYYRVLDRILDQIVLDASRPVRATGYKSRSRLPPTDG